MWNTYFIHLRYSFDGINFHLCCVFFVVFFVRCFKAVIWDEKMIATSTPKQIANKNKINVYIQSSNALRLSESSTQREQRIPILRNI